MAEERAGLEAVDLAQGTMEQVDLVAEQQQGKEITVEQALEMVQVIESVAEVAELEALALLLLAVAAQHILVLRILMAQMATRVDKAAEVETLVVAEVGSMMAAQELLLFAILRQQLLNSY
jgi:hypothetical protein